MVGPSHLLARALKAHLSRAAAIFAEVGLGTRLGREGLVAVTISSHLFDQSDARSSVTPYIRCTVFSRVDLGSRILDGAAEAVFSGEVTGA